MYDLPARAVMPGDVVAHAGEVVKVWRFTHTISIFFDNGVDWEMPPHELVAVDDVIVTPLDSELDFFLSDVYPTDTLPVHPKETA